LKHHFETKFGHQIQLRILRNDLESIVQKVWAKHHRRGGGEEAEGEEAEEETMHERNYLR
jgi:hypothetical protein